LTAIGAARGIPIKGGGGLDVLFVIHDEGFAPLAIHFQFPGSENHHGVEVGGFQGQANPRALEKFKGHGEAKMGTIAAIGGGAIVLRPHVGAVHPNLGDIVPGNANLRGKGKALGPQRQGAKYPRQGKGE
jgi:hypothetical protein